MAGRVLGGTLGMAQAAAGPVSQRCLPAGHVGQTACSLRKRASNPRLHKYLSSRAHEASRPSTPSNEPTGADAASDTVLKSEDGGVLWQLKKWGTVGFTTYGLLNALYYMVVIPFACFVVAKLGPGLGWQVAVQRLTEVAVSAWAMSQVIKIPRAFVALGLAPVMANVFDFILEHTGLTSKTQVLWLLVASSFAAFFAEMLIIVLYLT